METELTVRDIADVLDITERAVRKRAQGERWVTAGKKARGGRQKQYPVNMLPLDVRQAIAMHQADQTSMVPAASSRVPATMPSGLPAVPDQSKELGLAKYRLVHAWRSARKTAPWGKKCEAADAFVIAYNTGRLLPGIYNQVGEIAAPTLRALDRKLAKHGDDYVCLCDGRGGWKKHGTTLWRSRSISRSAQIAFLQCYLQPTQPSVSLAIRAARYMLTKNGIQEDSSDDTFRRWLKTDYAPLNGHVITLARKGMTAYTDQWAPYSTRDDTLLKVGDALVPDGKILNFQIRSPDTGQPARMVLIVFLDWASRYPVGWQIMPTESTTAIQAAFFNAVITIGKVPQVIYGDNGRAFKAGCFTKTDPDLGALQGLFARIGTIYQAAKPYWGRSKPVERFFLTVQEQLECLMPSYCGDSIATKPAWLHRNEKFHKQWHEAKTAGWIPTIREAAQIIDRYFTWYAHQPHSGINYQRPIDVLEQGQGRGELDLDQLRIDFLWRFKTKPRRCRITRWGVDYDADFLHGRSDQVVVMYDTAHLEKLYCYDSSLNYLGEAYPVQALHPLAKLLGTEAQLDAVSKEMRHQARLRKRVKADLLSLGATDNDLDGLNALPYNQKVAVLPAGSNENKTQKTLPEPEMSDAERRRLELVYTNAKAESDAAVASPQADRPEYFATPRERYEWCFRAIHQYGQGISNEDTGFMKDFEASDDFDDFKTYFNDLRTLFAMNEQEFAMG